LRGGTPAVRFPVPDQFGDPHPVVGRHRRAHRQLAPSCEHISLVSDKGNNSEETSDVLEDTPFHFVGSLAPSQHPDLLGPPPLAGLGISSRPDALHSSSVTTRFRCRGTVNSPNPISGTVGAMAPCATPDHENKRLGH
jgi:hypothetical protein